MRHRLLFVDDEENVLKTLQRLFHRGDYEILTASNGPEALSLLESNEVSLIISDQRMPGMSGAEFFSQAKILQPDAVRIMLTGYSDAASAVQAINEGRVYRFLPKPWSDSALIELVAESLTEQGIKKQNVALQEQVRRRNGELRELNEGLEAKVRQRTEELRRALRLSEGLNETLRRRNLATIKAFAGLLELNSPSVAAHCRRVAGLVPQVCTRLGVRDRIAAQDMTVAALLHDIGKIGLPEAVLAKPKAQLGREERQEVMKHVRTGEAHVRLVEGLEDVADMIRHHHENADGSGYPDGLVGDAIPLGARVVRALDFYDHLSRGTPRTGAEARFIAAALRAQCGRKFEEAVCAALLDVLGMPLEPGERRWLATAPDPTPADGRRQASAGESPGIFTEAVKSRRYQYHPPRYDAVTEARISLEKLEAGMVLSQDLAKEDGTLLLPKNEIISAASLGRVSAAFGSTPASRFAYVYRDKRNGHR
ncbi:MAG: response regulator [Deltaproteobacteria bacterium]|nr:response regulator [Deltaproteobacteria bacterium]